MKISPAVQSELVRAVVVTIIAGGIVYAGKRFFDKVAAKVSSVADIPGAVLDAATQAVDQGVANVKEAVSQTVDAAKVAVKQGGQAAKEKYQVNPRANDLKDNFEGKYNSPMVNDQGMDFTLF